MQKKRGDFSLPPSPHLYKLSDSLNIYEHLLVENLLYQLILISTNNLKLYLDFLKTQFNHTQYSGFKLKLII